MKIDSQLQTGYAAMQLANNSKNPAKNSEESEDGVSPNTETVSNPSEDSLNLSQNVHGSTATNGSSSLNPKTALKLSALLKEQISTAPGTAIMAQANINPQQAMQLLDEVS
jgi:hypothetical protein